MNPDSVFPTIHQLLIYVVSISSLDFFLWTLTKGSVFHHFFSLFNALHWQSDMLSLCSENGLWFQPWPLVPDASWSLCQSTAQFSHILRLETRERLQVHLIRDEFNTSHCIPTTFYLYISSITPKFQNWHSLTFNYAPVILNTFLFKWPSSNLTTKGWESSDLLLWLIIKKLHNEIPQLGMQSWDYFPFLFPTIPDPGPSSVILISAILLKSTYPHTLKLFKMTLCLDSLC